MNKIKEVMLILGAGAIGGWVSVIDAWQDSFSSPFTRAKVALLFIIPAVKGAIAAGIGVYLLTTVDTQRLTRTFFFAVTCGLAFPSILSNGSGYANNITSRVASTEVANSVQTLKSVTPNQPTSVSPSFTAESLTKLRDTSLSIIQAAPKALPDDAKAGDIAVQQAIGTLAKSATAKNDPAAVDTIKEIGLAAAAQNLPLTREAAINELKTLSSENSGATPQVREQGNKATERIEATRPN